MDDVEDVIKLPSSEKILVWTDNDLKYFGLREPTYLMGIRSCYGI